MKAKRSKDEHEQGRLDGAAEKAPQSKAAGTFRGQNAKRATDNDLPNGGYGDATDMLLRKLIQDETFLQSPMSEEGIYKSLVPNAARGDADSEDTRTSLKRSALRDAIIEFIRVQWLQRSERGIQRDSLNANRLVQLFGIRLSIERTATRRVISQDAYTRGQIAGDLLSIVKRQEGLAQCDDSDTDKRVDWFLRSVEFHVSIVQKAGFVDLANILESILWQLRIGCGIGIALESMDYRIEATNEHLQIVKDIRSGDWDEAVFIRDHIHNPMTRALRKLNRIQDDADVDEQIALYWDAVNSLFSA